MTDENGGAYLHEFIDDTFLGIHVTDYDKQFYICGPDSMIKSISDIIVAKGADPNAVVFEK